ncbi:MAG: 2-oxoacid:ferredoxin oxidoreductase subunit beta [Pyrinomonadaceae bacterium]|nr:2-oxoacid:ferredoxin oxidoreductase subunit beta [Pyrinomonadaceae bacterium]
MSILQKRHVLQSFERAKSTKAKEFRDTLPTWCPGCGHFTPLQGLYEAAERLKIKPKNFVLVSGIGCSGRFPFFIKGFGLHALHGRAIPVATGVKLANPELSVVAVGGDGDGVGIGGGHFPHAARSNFNLTYLLLDNAIYGLTKGQTSPTSPIGMKSGTSPYGNLAAPLNPLTMALTYGATFVARVFSQDRDNVTDLITEAIAHKGFSFIHVLSPCIEFHKTVTYESWEDKVSYLPENYVADNRVEALALSESKEPIYTGLFLRQSKASYKERVNDLQEKLRKEAAEIN